MSDAVPDYANLDEWIAREATPFSLEAGSFNAAVDQLLARLGDAVELLGLGEALHGGEEILQVRNRLFQRLVEAHGYRAIAIESSFPRGRMVDGYIKGHGPAPYEDGFSHGFGQMDATRELVEWMREYNADSAHAVKLSFYGFDAPTESYCTSSPRGVLHFVLDYLETMDSAGAQALRQRLDELLGLDADWENPAAMRDPAQSIGLSANAGALRLETEDLITDLRIRRPELVAASDEAGYAAALHYAQLARQLLNYHAASARTTGGPHYNLLLGIRDAMAADNLTYIVERERHRGKVLAFAHNAHVQRGRVIFPWYSFWPAGALIHGSFGPRYAVIGTGLGVSEANGIASPEAGTLEARLGPDAVFIPTFGGQGFPAEEIAALPKRSGSTKNPGYIPLSTESLTDFDALLFLPSATYTRGATPLP